MAFKSIPAVQGAVCLLGLLSPAIIRAQTSVSASAAIPTREEIQLAQPFNYTPPPSRLKIEADRSKSPCPLSDPQFATTMFILRDAVFDHVMGLAAADLRPAFADRIGKTLPVSAICEIRDAATSILRRTGYVAAVEIPQQNVQEGIVHFNVVMAKLVAVRLKNDAGRSAHRISSYLTKLTSSEVFNSIEAERYLLLAHDYRGWTSA